MFMKKVRIGYLSAARPTVFTLCKFAFIQLLILPFSAYALVDVALCSSGNLGTNWNDCEELNMASASKITPVGAGNADAFLQTVKAKMSVNQSTWQTIADFVKDQEWARNGRQVKTVFFSNRGWHPGGETTACAYSQNAITLHMTYKLKVVGRNQKEQTTGHLFVPRNPTDLAARFCTTLR